MASTEMLQDQAELPGKETSGTLNPEAKEFQMVTDEPTERLEEADTTIADPLKPQEEHNLQPATMETNSSKDQEARRAIDVPALSASMPLSAQFEQPSGIELPSDILRTSVSSLSASASAPTLDPLLAASSWPLKQSTAPENAADALLQPKLSKSSPAAPVEGFTAPDAMQELGSPLEENEQERDGTSSSQTATQQLIVSEQTTQQPTDASYQPEIRDEAEVRKQNGAVDTSQAHDTQTESDPGSDEAASVVEEDSTQPQALTDLLSHVEMPAWLAAYCEPSEDALLPTEDNNELENVRAPPVLLSSGGQTYWLFAPLIPEGQEAPAETGALSDANPVVSTPSVDAGEDKSRPNATATGLSTYPLLLSDDHELYFAPLSRVFDRLHDQFPSFHDEQMEIRLCVSELGVEIPEVSLSRDVEPHTVD